MSLTLRAGLAVALFSVLGGVLGWEASAHAGPVLGKLELPAPPQRPAIRAKGFLDRSENALAPIRAFSVAPYLAVALEPQVERPATPGQVVWELPGESFAHPVLAVPVGAEVVIKNTSPSARNLVAAEDAKLLAGGPINPRGERSFRTTEAKVYSFSDADAPHLKGKLVVVAAPYVATVDESNKFEIPDVAEGAYKVKVFFYDPTSGAADWLDVKADLNVPVRGKAEVTVKVPKWPAPPTKK